MQREELYNTNLPELVKTLLQRGKEGWELEHASVFGTSYIISIVKQDEAAVDVQAVVEDNAEEAGAPAVKRPGRKPKAAE